MATSFGAAPDYVGEALGELRKRAHTQNLKVDSSATLALQTGIEKALAGAQQHEGFEALSSAVHHADFNQSIAVLAIEATKAAQADQAEYIQPEHIEIAINELAGWDFWPFKGD